MEAPVDTCTILYEVNGEPVLDVLKDEVDILYDQEDPNGQIQQ